MLPMAMRSANESPSTDSYRRNMLHRELVRPVWDQKFIRTGDAYRNPRSDSHDHTEKGLERVRQQRVRQTPCPCRCSRRPPWLPPPLILAATIARVSPHGGQAVLDREKGGKWDSGRAQRTAHQPGKKNGDNPRRIVEGSGPYDPYLQKFQNMAFNAPCIENLLVYPYCFPTITIGIQDTNFFRSAPLCPPASVASSQSTNRARVSHKSLFVCSPLVSVESPSVRWRHRCRHPSSASPSICGTVIVCLPPSLCRYSPLQRQLCQDTIVLFPLHYGPTSNQNLRALCRRLPMMDFGIDPDLDWLIHQLMTSSYMLSLLGLLLFLISPLYISHFNFFLANQIWTTPAALTDERRQHRAD